MEYTLLGAITASLLAACTHVAPSSSLVCNALPGTRQVLQENIQPYLIFGELHGTQEAPRAFAEIVCEAARQGPVIVGIERSETMQAAIQAYIDSRGTLEDEAALLAGVFDGSGWGLSSEAILALFQRLQGLKQAGSDIRVTAFRNGKMGPGGDQNPYEAGLADSLVRAYQKTPNARVLVLVGNIHARLVEKEAFSNRPGFSPMALHLPRDERLTFNLGYAGGTAFNCTAQGCAERPAQASPISAAPGLHLDGASPAYDGIWFVGKISAARPIGGTQDKGDVK